MAEMAGSSRSHCATCAAYRATVGGRRTRGASNPSLMGDLSGKFDTETTLPADQGFLRHRRSRDWPVSDRAPILEPALRSLTAPPRGAQYRANFTRTHDTFGEPRGQ